MSITEQDHSKDLIFLVLSVWDDKERREILRETLDKDNLLPGLALKRQLIFVFGLDSVDLSTEEINDLEQEQKQHQDLLIWSK